MKHSLLVILLSFIFVDGARAQKTTSKSKSINVAEDIDSLGGNEELMKKAQKLHSFSHTRIIQDRIVDRRNRLELGVSYAGNFGGDTYMQTQSFGAAAFYHITPRWVIGVKYTDFSNSLTPEGQRVFDQYRNSYEAGGVPGYAVDVDFPLQSTVGYLHWYPIYGKTSFLDTGVSQFDLYFLAGAGKIELSSGPSPTYVAGVGIGAWLSKHLSLRGEFQYQTYKDRPITGERSLNVGSASVGLGWIL